MSSENNIIDNKEQCKEVFLILKFNFIRLLIIIIMTLKLM